MNRTFLLVALVAVLLFGGLFFLLYEEHAHETGWSLGPAHAAGPEQPVLFSHKIHAGDRGISCTYCHQFVDRADYAGIPSMDTCLGCHKTLNTGNLEQWKQDEIAKFMSGPPGAATLKEPEKPIEWKRVYDLTNHVHFPHKVHVWALAKGEPIESTCVSCHGDIASMEVVRQDVDLIRMGTCLSCHHKEKASTDCWACHY